MMLAVWLPPSWLSLIALTFAVVAQVAAAVTARRQNVAWFPTWLLGAFMSSVWWVAVAARTFGVLTRLAYLDLVAPLAPVAFVVVGALPAFTFVSRSSRLCRTLRETIASVDANA